MRKSGLSAEDGLEALHRRGPLAGGGRSCGLESAAGCIVVGTIGGTCGTTDESCASGGLIPGTGKCNAQWEALPGCLGQSCYLTPGF